MSSPALVVLDLDGTLIDLAVDWDFVRRGMASELASRGLVPSGGVSATLAALAVAGEREAADACLAIVAEAERNAVAGSRVNLAMLRWLRLHAATSRLAVLTLNDPLAALEAVRRLGLADRVDRAHVVGRGDAPAKPAPDGLIRLLRRRGVAEADAVLIGDSESDHACGRAAGVATIDVREIGVEWGTVPDARPAPVTAD